jgi:hypothetical protein
MLKHDNQKQLGRKGQGLLVSHVLIPIPRKGTTGLKMSQRLLRNTANYLALHGLFGSAFLCHWDQQPNDGTAHSEQHPLISTINQANALQRLVYREFDKNLNRTHGRRHMNLKGHGRQETRAMRQPHSTVGTRNRACSRCN